MSGIKGAVYVAPLKAHKPKGADTKLGKPYSLIGYTKDIYTLSSVFGGEYCRLLFDINELNFDTERIPKESAKWVIDVITSDEEIRRIVFPCCEPITILNTDAFTVEVTIDLLGDGKGHYRYDYFGENKRVCK